ncbi:MAG: aminopeptidase P N-terminal domain-containing protein [Alistipes sp.]|nr:aminopeptidase P N-terminal domain-containing protein [Candidatus Alistipes equi]
MFKAQTYVSRRNELSKRIGNGIILFPGNSFASRNYPNNAYTFRQDSSFLYFFGLNLPDMFGIIDTESQESILFGNDVTVDDIIWMGPQPEVSELAASVGVTKSFPLSKVKDFISKAQQQKREIHFLPPYRSLTKIQLSDILGKSVQEVEQGRSVDLMFAVAEMREVKSEEEIEELQKIQDVGYLMHTTAMHMCREGVVEREIVGVLSGITKSYGLDVSFETIVSQHGETLHNTNCDGILKNGRLLLVDAGAESLTNYCSDHTRTFPISGKFTQKQKDIYEIVLRAHNLVPLAMKTGARYHEDVHLLAYRYLAEGLKEVGLIKSSAEDAVAAGAMYLFMPHGLGHGLGMDVHDCEAFGERSFDFTNFLDRARRSATCTHRATWVLHNGTVLSDEPGIYFIPALIDKCEAEGKFRGIVNYELLKDYRDFGGIRIEDDILVRDNGGIMLGKKRIPVKVEEVEEEVGKQIL